MVDLYQMRAAVFAVAKTFLHGTTKYGHVRRMKDSAFEVAFLKHFYDEEFVCHRYTKAELQLLNFFF
jgi:hypothetical protein